MAGMRRQPHGRVQIDWNNPIARGLVFAYVVTATGLVGYGSNGANNVPFVATYGLQFGNAIGAAVVTPQGYGAKTLIASNPIVTLPDFPAAQSSSFSLFALATGPASGTQSVIDDDDGSTRRYQFRLNAGKVEFIPFNSVGGQTITVPSALTAAELARGFAMGASAGPSRYAVLQGSQIASATPSGALLTPTAKPTIGARKSGTQQYALGGLSLLCLWSRTLADDELRSLAVDPWQLFASADDGDDIVAPAVVTYTLSAASGLFSMTAAAAGVYAARKLQASQGSFALAAATAGLTASRRLLSDSASFAMSGNSTPILVARKLVANLGVFGMTSTAASLIASRRLTAPPGAFVLSSGTVQMVYTPAHGPSGPTYVLGVVAGSFGLSGSVAGLLFNRRLRAATGTLVLTGVAAKLQATRRLQGDSAAFMVAGSAVVLRYSGSTGPIDISKIPLARIVVFEGSGSRVVQFEGSGSRVVPFDGSGSRVGVFEGSGSKTVRLE